MSRRVTPRHRAAPPPTTQPRRLIRRVPLLIAVVGFVALTAFAADALTAKSHHGSGGSPLGVKELLGRAESASAAESRSAADLAGTGDISGPSRSAGTSGSSGSAGSSPSAASRPSGASTAPSSGATAATVAAPPAAGSASAPAAGSTSAAPVAKPAAPPSINISSNIAFSPSPNNSACSSAPTGATCTNDAIAALNHARSVLGIAPYAIPSNFGSMNPAQQLLTLSNLDRAVFGLQQIAGLNATLNTSAQQGVASRSDPAGVNVGSNQWQTWGSNWAAGYPNAAYTYYAWMYDDGLGSANGDCTSSNSSGCWGHRLNTLHNFGSGVQVAMGAGYSGTTFTELYESFAASASIPYL